MNKQVKNGFTLVELIVTMVISSIVLTLVASLTISFTKTSNESKIQQKKAYEQNVIVKSFEKFANEVNLATGKVVYQVTTETLENDDYIETGFCLINCENESQPKTIFTYDKKDRKISYNSLTYELDNIQDIKIEEKFDKIFVVTLEYENDKTYVFSLYFINQEKEGE